jgi:hypothetical protein
MFLSKIPASFAAAFIAIGLHHHPALAETASDGKSTSTLSAANPDPSSVTESLKHVPEARLTHPRIGSMAVRAEGGTTVTAVDSKGKRIWSANVLEKAPRDGVDEGPIRYIGVLGSEVTVISGKSTFYRIDPETGKVTYGGRN